MSRIFSIVVSFLIPVCQKQDLRVCFECVNNHMHMYFRIFKMRNKRIDFLYIFFSLVREFKETFFVLYIST